MAERRWEAPGVPEPGSAGARAAGCRCPSPQPDLIDVRTGGPVWSINLRCRMHNPDGGRVLRVDHRTGKREVVWEADWGREPT